jgi:hypothetical protein
MKELERIKQENQYLRAHLISSEINSHRHLDDNQVFDLVLLTLKRALSGNDFEYDMDYIQRFNNNDIDINEVK